MGKPLFQGEQIFELIPQRPPMVMIDSVLSVSKDAINTCLTVEESNLFVQDGYLSESGVIEHIAQSAAAMAGYGTYACGHEPRLGYIGEIKKCRFFSLPQVGQTVCTELNVLGEAAGVTLLSAVSRTEGMEVAECQMKIFLEQQPL
ncbi:MAG: hydroxymyristoyl-ACP dehydratase [Paludibacteraceae bacterium]|nr:hydroxymyristoyl-ACP dehydratase [Paludibacteraceae bacterium]